MWLGPWGQAAPSQSSGCQRVQEGGGLGDPASPSSPPCAICPSPEEKDRDSQAEMPIGPREEAAVSQKDTETYNLQKGRSDSVCREEWTLKGQAESFKYEGEANCRGIKPNSLSPDRIWTWLQATVGEPALNHRGPPSLNGVPRMTGRA